MLTATAPEALAWMRRRLGGPARIFVPGCSGEPTIFAEALADDRTLAADLTFLGIWIPGINRTDYAALSPSAHSELIFLSADFRASFEKGAARFRPLTYTQSFSWLKAAPIDAALIQVSAPDKDSRVSLGVSADFSTAVWNRSGVLKIAHVNPTMPAPKESPKIGIDAFDVIVQAPRPLLSYAPANLPPVFEKIADNIAALIRNGDTLQFGLGNVQLAVLKALRKKKRLRIHSGMVSDPVLDAIDAGAIAKDDGAVTTGVAVGGEALYKRAGADARFRFKPVSYTHAIDTLAGIDDFVAINSVIEVDLFGQANGEYLGGKQISGGGGLTDFLRGAAASRGGRPVMALASTAKGGAVSRIIPKLAAPSVSVTRADAGIVVTEYGAADLRGLTIEERAGALIDIAHPDHRNSLTADWLSMREGL